MLNLPDPKVFWNDMAKSPESKSPGVKHSEKLKRTSLASKLKLSKFSGQFNEYTELDQNSTASEDEQRVSEENDEDSTFAWLQKTIMQNVSQPGDTNEPHSESSTNLEHVRSSTLAARRYLERPPRNVNIVSHAFPSYVGNNEDIDDDKFPGSTPLPPSTGAVRTPMTANLRSRIEERIYEPDLMKIIDAYAEEKMKRDRKLYTPRQKTPMAEIVFGLDSTAYESPIAALRVRMLLTPAMILLSRPSTLKADDVETAIRYARSAQDLAKSESVEQALEARCS
jgi:hypothetical protein